MLAARGAALLGRKGGPEVLQALPPELGDAVVRLGRAAGGAQLLVHGMLRRVKLDVAPDAQRIGMAGHQLVVPRMADAVDMTLPSYMTDVWSAPALAGPALAGVLIAVLGAYVPARRAGRLTIAQVLHNE